MPLELFKKINTELKSYTDELYYHIIGDPLVLSNLSEYLDISLSNDLKVNITTSGFFIDENRFETLTHKAIKQINFSLNSFNANSTDESFENYMDPILEFCRYKIASSNNLFVNLRLWNFDEEQSSYEYNKRVFAYINNFFDTQIDIDEIYRTKPKNIRIANKVLFNFDDYFEWPSLNNSYYEPSGFCHGLGSQLGIHSCGKVVPCCLDKEGIIDLGNLNKNSLKEILDSKRAIDIINGFKDKKAVEELCKRCSYKKRFG